LHCFPDAPRPADCGRGRNLPNKWIRLHVDDCPSHAFCMAGDTSVQVMNECVSDVLPRSWFHCADPGPMSVRRSAGVTASTGCWLPDRTGNLCCPGVWIPPGMEKRPRDHSLGGWCGLHPRWSGIRHLRDVAPLTGSGTRSESAGQDAPG
jgi:hypothetical protein